jgi:pilus assembly protein Flp/PilA
MWSSLTELLADLWFDESGHSMIEYGLCAALIALAIIGVVNTIATKVNAPYETISNQM